MAANDSGRGVELPERIDNDSNRAMTSTTHNVEATQNGMREPTQACSSMDHAEIAKLIETQYGGLLNLMRAKLKDNELAADLLNEAIATTLEHARLGRLTQPERVAGYVFKVGMNLLRNHRRNTDNRYDLRSDVDALDVLAVHDSDHVETAQVARNTVRLIESLTSPRDREVVKRFYLDEEDKQTICAQLGLTPLQFTQVMSRARQRLKALFDARGFERGDFL
jgi:RNA polymerase sigma-70 factor, ECF subfamily